MTREEKLMGAIVSVVVGGLIGSFVGGSIGYVATIMFRNAATEAWLYGPTGAGAVIGLMAGLWSAFHRQDSAEI